VLILIGAAYGGANGQVSDSHVGSSAFGGANQTFELTCPFFWLISGLRVLASKVVNVFSAGWIDLLKTLSFVEERKLENSVGFFRC
jgi:hypothetical protein